MGSQLAAILAGSDSEEDGFTNLAEITAFFFPGNAADHPVRATLPAVTIAATDAIATEPRHDHGGSTR